MKDKEKLEGKVYDFDVTTVARNDEELNFLKKDWEFLRKHLSIWGSGEITIEGNFDGKTINLYFDPSTKMYGIGLNDNSRLREDCFERNINKGKYKLIKIKNKRCLISRKYSNFHKPHTRLENTGEDDFCEYDPSCHA